MRTEIAKLHKRLGTTFIYVTHDQTEAMTMGDRIVVMKDGFIQQVDTPQNLYDLPVNEFVAGFMGSPQMNFIELPSLRKAQITTSPSAQLRLRFRQTRLTLKSLTMSAKRSSSASVRKTYTMSRSSSRSTRRPELRLTLKLPS